MGKLEEYMKGRTEGMEFALRLVKDKGIEELEKEIKFRNRTGISLNVTILGIAALHDAFGFGEKRCQRFMDKMGEGAEYLMNDLATWEDYISAIKEELGMNLKIRWNREVKNGR